MQEAQDEQARPPNTTISTLSAGVLLLFST
jgi:hypothetical protein